MWFDTPAYVFFLILVVAIYWRSARTSDWVPAVRAGGWAKPSPMPKNS